VLFCSQSFLLFFTCVFALYWALPGKRARVYLLLAASFAFYASWNRLLAGLICLTTVFDYLLARGMEVSASPRRRRLLLVLSLLVNLGLLVYFKYANFFLRSLEDALRASGASASLPVLSVILPVGISFYTFEAINYTVDVYRRRIPAERNLAHFMLFILFFPHLIAGPIVRARDFLPQVARPKRWDWARMHLGAQLFVLGLFKKLAIADRMALFADAVFADPAAYRSTAVWCAVVAWAVQVYCDFSGYTDMALGTAHLLGYKLAPNFNMPYLSVNISEFWRRWHMSLSGWLRDYLFIPLGGSRGGRWKTYRNLMLTMILGGLWHGASWTFVLWGAAHGGLLVVHRGFREWCDGRPRLTDLLRTVPGTVLRTALTLLAVCFTWVFFRAGSLHGAVTMLGRMVVPATGLRLPMNESGLWPTVAVVALAHCVGAIGLPRSWCRWTPAPVQGFAFAAAVSLALLLAPQANKAFIYFQF
jgi:alginate O-acetyltransferase complex protein AlgI